MSHEPAKLSLSQIRLLAAARTMRRPFASADLVRTLGLSAEQAREGMAWLAEREECELVRTSAPSGVS